MPLVASTIPNLIGGISQQPPALRLSTTCEDMLNTWPSVVNGLQKRPPTRHISSIGSALTGGAFGYLIERNETYRYLVILQNGDLKVLDLNDGTFKTVNFPNGKTYLAASSPVDAFHTVTFGDYTFIANNTITVTTAPVTETTLALSGDRRNPTTEATIYVTSSIGNSYYTIYIDGVLKASYLTNATTVPDTVKIASELEKDLNTAGYTTVNTGSTLTITNFPATSKIRAQGNTGDKSMRAFTRSVQSFSDLPPTSPEGRIVEVSGDLSTDGDNYYVVFRKGIWEETLNWNAGEAYNAGTMPHVLIREADGTWTFKQHVWKDRTVGNSDSCKNPSFVNTTINDIFVYNNRLGVLADENIVLSEADNYENFYRTTTAQLIDSDPIDLAVLHSNVDVLHHAVAYNRDLLLMSEKNQFRFSYQQYLGQKTASIQYSTSFNVSTRVHPVNVGNSIYFVDDRPDYQYTKMYEFFPKDNSTQDDADEVSSPVPELIPNDIIFSAASNRAKAVVTYSGSTPDSLYVYKFFWAGDRKAQSAWTKWQFPDVTKIYWAGFSGTFLYMLIERPSGVMLERIRLDEDVFNTDYNYELLIDRRYTYATNAGVMTYNPTLNVTTVTLPFASASILPEFISNDPVNGIFGLRGQVTRVNSTTIKVLGDVTGYQNTIGIPYTMSYEFSTLFAKQQKGQGEVVMLDGRTQIRYLTLEYHKTAYFTTKLITPGRDIATTTFVGSIVGSAEAELGRQSFASGKYRLPVMSENLKARIIIENDSPFPCAFGSAEWQGIIAPKAVQRL